MILPLLIINVVFAARPAAANPLPPNVVFQPNESLVYSLKFIDTTAGECVLETLPDTTWSGHAVRHFRASIKTVGLVGAFYPYTEIVDLYAETDRLRPLFVDVNIHDRKKVQHTQITLDQTTLHGEELEDSTEPDEPPHHRVKGWTMTADSQSLFSILHYIRLQGLTPGTELKFPVSHDEKNAEFAAEVVKVEPVPTAKGERDGVLVRVKKSFANVYYGSVHDEPLLWFSNDDRRVPLRFEFKHRLGRVFATLKNPPP